MLTTFKALLTFLLFNQFTELFALYHYHSLYLQDAAEKPQPHLFSL